MFLKKLYLILSQKKIVIISLVTTSIITLILTKLDTMLSQSDGMGIIYLEIAFTKENFEGVILSWGERGIDQFLDFAWIDFLYPASYSILLSSASAFITMKNSDFDINNIKKSDRYIFIIPFIAALFDYIENIQHLIILSQRLFLRSLIFSASISASIKWFLVLFSLFNLLRIYFAFRRRPHSTLNPPKGD